MKRLLRPQLGSAHAIAAIALFLALAGGAYAAATVPKNSIGTSQLRNAAVTGAKVKDGSLGVRDFGGGLPSGPRGQAGPKGEAGDDGSKGARGAEGEAGPKGPEGPRGERGAAGADGGPGPSGPQGEKGPAGPRGERGQQGEAGADGAQGPRGIAGQRGDDGAAGATGARGERGARGEAGEQGDRGPRGERGPQGEPGEEGPAGKAGTSRTVVRYGPRVEVRRVETSYAGCRKGEAVTGGGFEILKVGEGKFPYLILADRPSLPEQAVEKEGEEGEEGEFETGFPLPREGEEATGWAVTLGSVDSAVVFQAYVECAVRNVA